MNHYSGKRYVEVFITNKQTPFLTLPDTRIFSFFVSAFTNIHMTTRPEKQQSVDHTKGCFIATIELVTCCPVTALTVQSKCIYV